MSNTNRGSFGRLQDCAVIPSKARTLRPTKPAPAKAPAAKAKAKPAPIAPNASRFAHLKPAIPRERAAPDAPAPETAASLALQIVNAGRRRDGKQPLKSL